MSGVRGRKRFSPKATLTVYISLIKQQRMLDYLILSFLLSEQAAARQQSATKILLNGKQSLSMGV